MKLNLHLNKLLNKLYVLAFALIFILMASGCSSGQGQPAAAKAIITKYPELQNKSYTVETVTRIIDGDTFETRSGMKVRLIGINTPEITKGKTEAYGLEAKNYSEEKLKGNTVYLFRDVGDTDKYARLLRYVFIESEAVMFNELLVREGYANTMTVPPNVTFAKLFTEAERDARNNSRGLWGAGDQGNAPDKPAPASCEKPMIKGNINSKNEKIYHLPGGRYYEKPQAEQMFCSEEAANAAGFRKSKD